MDGFAGKVCVVTGAGSGIGQALALELGRSGAKVAISDVDAEGLATTEKRRAADNAAECAVRGFTEALRQEMITNRHPVKVTTVHPGGIKTAIMRNATA